MPNVVIRKVNILFDVIIHFVQLDNDDLYDPNIDNNDAQYQTNQMNNQFGQSNNLNPFTSNQQFGGVQVRERESDR